MKTCMTCGMPFVGEHANDIGLETPEGAVCKFDVEDGRVKAPEAIFEGGVQFFAQYVDGDRAMAERVTCKNMKSLPYWQQHPFDLLNAGPEATDDEFGAVMAKIGA